MRQCHFFRYFKKNNKETNLTFNVNLKGVINITNEYEDYKKKN